MASGDWTLKLTQRYPGQSASSLMSDWAAEEGNKHVFSNI
jgi:hypothetical protein